MGLPYKKGSNGQEIRDWQDWAYRYAPSYADLIGPKDAYYGLGEEAFTKRMQQNLHIPETGIFDEYTAGLVNFKSKSVTAPTITYRPIWFYSNPGSGANEFVGPSFEVGELCKNILKINHQPVHSAIGGYLGLMGGDPKLSYDDVIFDQYKSIEWLLDHNPDVQSAIKIRELDPKAHVPVELWFSGYSQKADGLEDALIKLFGNDGKYILIRDRINGIIQYGNPSRQPGPTKVGNNPPGWGIARKKRPEWIKALVWDIVTQSPGAPDFYACADDDIRPLFYEWFVKAETELPFVIYSAQIIIPALLNLVAPFLSQLGGLASPLATGVLAGATGLPTGLLSQLIGGVATAKTPPNPALIEFLSVRGVLTNLPALIGLLGKISGVQTHGEYHLPKPEFGGRTGIQVGYDIVAAFRR
ncbi:gp43 [Mycobacterium phage Konstantine]|uniref:Lysin B n=1 Tax=Mycobacterium phage Konstantine TaxID=563121 RepID=B5U513_9CAUD|nr:gp43 [Mycobacterium phage Konstantine]ACI12459.1 lysin B [Mycobacterium phage Konstantine]